MLACAARVNAILAELAIALMGLLRAWGEATFWGDEQWDQGL